jgi:hypothetical protein
MYTLYPIKPKNNKKMLISKKTTPVSLAVCFVLIIAGCYYDKEDLLYPNNTDCTTINAKYSTDIAPLMSSKCTTSGCHDAASNAAGLTLENYAQVSALAGSINQRCIVARTMPPSDVLTATEYSKLKCWIISGVPNN